MLVDSLQYFHHQIELQAGALRAFVVCRFCAHRVFIHAWNLSGCAARPEAQGWAKGLLVLTVWVFLITNILF